MHQTAFLIKNGPIWTSRIDTELWKTHRSVGVEFGRSCMGLFKLILYLYLCETQNWKHDDTRLASFSASPPPVFLFLSHSSSSPSPPHPFYLLFSLRPPSLPSFSFDMFFFFFFSRSVSVLACNTHTHTHIQKHETTFLIIGPGQQAAL